MLVTKPMRLLARSAALLICFSCTSSMGQQSAETKPKTENASSSTDPVETDLFDTSARIGNPRIVNASQDEANEKTAHQTDPSAKVAKSPEDTVGQEGAASQLGGNAGGGNASGSSGGGGYGAMYGAMGGSGGPLLDIVVRQRSGPSGSLRKTRLTASRVVKYRYRHGSLKPSRVAQGYGSGMYGGYGGGYGGEAGSYGGGGYGGEEGGYGAGGYGGEGGGYGGEGAGYGGMDGGDYAGGMGHGGNVKTSTIHAYIFDKERENGRTKIILVVPTLSKKPTRSGGRVIGGMYGGGAGPGYGGESAGGGMYGGGMDGGGMDGGAGSDDMYGGVSNHFDAIELLSARDMVDDPLPVKEVELVSKIIRQDIWKQDAINRINHTDSGLRQFALAEELLKEVLTEQYETQMARQSIEIGRIERRVAELRDELSRREAAKMRVVEVQLGRIVLEAQGLLSK